MKVFASLIFAILLGALLIPMVGRVEGDRQTQEASDITQLLMAIIAYTEREHEFPETVKETLENDYMKYFIEFIENPNFTYIKPTSAPEETKPTTTLIEFSMEEGTYTGYLNGHVEFFD